MQKSSVYLWDKMGVILPEVLKGLLQILVYEFLSNKYHGRSRRGHGCLSVVSVMCFQVEVSSTGRSLVQTSPNDYCVSECDREASIMRRTLPTRGCCAMKKKRIRGKLTKPTNVERRRVQESEAFTAAE